MPADPSQRDDWYAQVDAGNSQYGAILIDANPPVGEVVDPLLTELHLPKR